MAVTDSSVGVAPVKSSKPAVSWGPIIAGAFAASTVSAILILVGAGLGLTMVSPWAGDGAGVTTIAASTAAWLVLVQWLSAAVGGYLAGRLRTKWVGVHTDEIYFRDTAHGFLAWALATLLVVGLLSSALSTVIGGGVQAASTVASGAAMGATATAGAAASNAGSGDAAGQAMAYFSDQLFRPNDPARLAAPGAEGDAAAAAQATRVLATSAAAGEMAPEDRTWLAQLVAARTGLSQPDAEARVDQVMARVDEAKTKAAEAADAARKAAATFALVTALSLVIGAFIASAAAAYGGSQRDEDEDVRIVRR